MDLGIDGGVALVAASSQGLGRAAARELAGAGASVVLCARGEEHLEATAAGIRSDFGVPVEAVAADLAQEEGVREVLDRALQRFHRVDVLVTNAGGPPSGAFEDHDLERWRGAVRLNLESAVGLTQGVLPGMKERGWGRIINITSVAVKQPVDGLILSNAVRAAVTGFARTLANEVAPYGVTVNNVLPGFTRTERLEELAANVAEREGIGLDEAFARWEKAIPASRLGNPEELAALVGFLASQRAAYITGTSIPVDGGWVRGLT